MDLRTLAQHPRAPTAEEVLAGLVALLGELVSYPVERMGPSLRLRDELGLDSSDLTVLMVQIEEATGIAVDEEHEQAVETLGDAAELLHTLLRRQRAEAP